MKLSVALQETVTDLYKVVALVVGSVFFFCLGLVVLTVRHVRKTKE